MFADKFRELVSLTNVNGGGWKDPGFPAAEKNFFENALDLALSAAQPEAAYFSCFARVSHNLGRNYIDPDKINEILELYSGTDFAPLHWLAYRFYGFIDDGEIDEPNPFTDKTRAWQRLERAIELGDVYSMQEKAFFLNVMGSPADQVEKARELIEDAVIRDSKSACFLNGCWWLSGGSIHPYNEEAAEIFLQRAIDLPADIYERESNIQETALFELAKLHLNSRDIAQDREAGIREMREAAKAGNLYASIWIDNHDFKEKKAESPMSFFSPNYSLEKAEERKKQVGNTDFDTAMEELDNMIGLDEIKRSIRSIVYQEKASALRRNHGMAVANRSYHMVLTGNPGTGKTELAKRMGRIFKNLGILETDRVHLASRAILIGEYVGQTAIQVREAVRKAKGGILFIDEAYSLASPSERDYGHEAIETLLLEMEENRHDLVVIVAGYPDLMNGFLQSNPGLASRFTLRFDLANYSENELTKIFQAFCHQNDYAIDEDAAQHLTSYFRQTLKERSHRFANAREVRSLFEKAIEKQARRIVEAGIESKEGLREIQVTDLPLKKDVLQGNVVYLATDKSSD